MDYLLTVIALILVFAAAGTALNLIVGETGHLSLFHGALFGIGAYAAALASSLVRLPIPVGLAAGCVLGALLALLGSVASRGTTGDTFALVTFALHLVFLDGVTNLSGITRGSKGLSDIPRFSLHGFDLSPAVEVLVGSAAVLGLIMGVCMLVLLSPQRRALRAIRDDSRFAASLGVDPHRFTRQVFVLTGALCGLAGGSYVHVIGFLEPRTVDEMLSVTLLSVVIVGGAGSIAAGVAGAVVVIGLPEVARFVGASEPSVASIRQILVGSSLVGLMLLSPKGLFGSFDLRRSR